ncbi:MAG: pyridoxal phosphate-dependent aminotransferase, partial [Lachnospiraceae bacterium]
MIAEKMVGFVENNSAIRMMFEEGKRLSKLYGAENVYDFSLGNPNVPAPCAVDDAIKDILDSEDSSYVHGYMSNAGYEDVRRTIADSLNRRFVTDFTDRNLIMTVGAAGGL